MNQPPNLFGWLFHFIRSGLPKMQKGSTMERITKNDLDVMFKRYNRVATNHDLIREGYRLVLEVGSKTYGRAFRLYETPTEQGKGGGYYNPRVGSDFLGMTTREAYNNLADRARVLEDVFYVIEQNAKGEEA